MTNGGHSPLIEALLACEIAGVGFDPASGGLDEEPEGAFLVESELRPGLSLSIEYREEPASFVVRSDTAIEGESLFDVMRTALQLNHVAPETDLFSVDPSSSCIVFVRRLPAERLDLADLALAVRAAVEAGLSLACGEVPGILLPPLERMSPDPSSEIGIIRG